MKFHKREGIFQVSQMNVSFIPTKQNYT